MRKLLLFGFLMVFAAICSLNAKALTCNGIEFDDYYQNIGGCPSGDYYYVEQSHPQANDNNPGTEALPWLTIQKAASVLQAGDAVIVKEGDYGAEGMGSRFNPAIKPINSGTAGNPIIFKALGDVIVGVIPSAYGNVQAATASTITLDSSASSQDNYYNGWVIRITGGTGAGQYRKISNPGFISYYGSTKLAYVLTNWSIIPDGTSLYSLTRPGPIIGTSGVNYIVWDGFNVKERDSYAPDTGPVTLGGSNYVYFINNDIEAQPFPQFDNHNCIRIEGTSNFVIRNNRIHGLQYSVIIPGNNPQNHAALMTYSASNGIIENNEFYDSYSCVFPKGGNNYNLTIRYNYVHNCSKGLRMSFTQNSSAYQNIFADSGLDFQPAESLANIKVYNNIFYNSASTVNNWYAVSGFSMFNNIFYGVDNPFKFDSSAGTFSSDYNIFYNYLDFVVSNGNVGGLAAWQALGFDAHSQNTNPSFVSPGIDFHLSQGSPALTFGRDIQDHDNDGDTAESIPVGMYLTGTEQIGIVPSGASPFCGDTLCNNGENCTSCPADCGACPPPRAYHPCDNSPANYNVTYSEFNTMLNAWYVNSDAVSMYDLITCVKIWKEGGVY